MSYNDIQNMSFNKYEMLSEIMNIEEQHENREMNRHTNKTNG